MHQILQQHFRMSCTLEKIPKVLKIQSECSGDLDHEKPKNKRPSYLRWMSKIIYKDRIYVQTWAHMSDDAIRAPRSKESRRLAWKLSACHPINDRWHSIVWWSWPKTKTPVISQKAKLPLRTLAQDVSFGATEGWRFVSVHSHLTGRAGMFYWETQSSRHMFIHWMLRE